jgi:hypothetical protein
MQSLIDLAGPIEVRLDDLIEVGDGRFVACTRMVGQGAKAPYTQSFAVVHRLRDGLIVEADYYLDRDPSATSRGAAGIAARYRVGREAPLLHESNGARTVTQGGDEPYLAAFSRYTRVTR